MSNIINRPPTTKSGLYKAPSHKDGGVQVIIDNVKKVEVEGDEIHLCKELMQSDKVYSFKDKTNKEILDSLFQSQGCVFEQGKANSGDHIVCKLVVKDSKKRDIEGTPRQIFNIMQEEKSCRLSGDNNFEGGGKINKDNNMPYKGWEKEVTPKGNVFYKKQLGSKKIMYTIAIEDKKVKVLVYDDYNEYLNKYPLIESEEFNDLDSAIEWSENHFEQKIHKLYEEYKKEVISYLELSKTSNSWNEKLKSLYNKAFNKVFCYKPHLLKVFIEMFTMSPVKVRNEVFLAPFTADSYLNKGDDEIFTESSKDIFYENFINENIYGDLNWFIPEKYRYDSDSPSKHLTNINPLDKVFTSLFGLFISNDNIDKEVFRGVNFDNYGVTATDGRKLIHLPFTDNFKSKFRGLFNNKLNKSIKSDNEKPHKIDIKYVDYQKILPVSLGSEAKIYSFNSNEINELINQCKSFSKCNLNKISYYGEPIIIFETSDNEYASFDLNYFIDLLYGCQLLGSQKIQISLSYMLGNRLLISEDINNFSSKNRTSWGMILMGVYDQRSSKDIFAVYNLENKKWSNPNLIIGTAQKNDKNEIKEQLDALNLLLSDDTDNSDVKEQIQVLELLMEDNFENGGEMKSDPYVATEILNQLGGMNRLKLMMGAYNFAYDNNSLSFRIKNQKTNYVKISLNSLDLYDIEIGQIRGMDYKIKSEFNNIYLDNLKSSIEKGTGMYLSFKKGGTLNPYAVCTTSISKTTGTTQRKFWSDSELEKYERCVLSVKEKMNDGGELDENTYLGIYDKSTKKLKNVVRFKPEQIGSDAHIRLTDSATDGNYYIKRITKEDFENFSILQVDDINESKILEDGGEISIWEHGNDERDSRKKTKKLKFNYTKTIDGEEIELEGLIVPYKIGRADFEDYRVEVDYYNSDLAEKYYIDNNESIDEEIIDYLSSKEFKLSNKNNRW